MVPLAEKDLTTKTLESHNSVFADIVNVLLFKGKHLMGLCLCQDRKQAAGGYRGHHHHHRGQEQSQRPLCSREPSQDRRSYLYHQPPATGKSSRRVGKQSDHGQLQASYHGTGRIQDPRAAGRNCPGGSGTDWCRD